MKATEDRRNVLLGQPESCQYKSACAPSMVMTGMPARQKLSDILDHSLAAGDRLAVFVIKISELGQINHSRGYEAGDEAIREVVQRIDQSHPLARFGGRLGGGHFMAIGRVPSTETRPRQAPEGHFCDIINAVVESLSHPIELPCGPVYVSCAIGASIAPTDTDKSDELLCNAELALRSAYRGSYSFYYSALREAVSDRMAVRSALAGAMERDEFQLVYQPQVCQENGTVFGVEALLRWQSPALGAVSPARFVPVAESAGLMPELGEWVLNRACQQARAWLDAGTPLRVSVNACAAQLENGDFLQRVQKALSITELPPHLLEIEVTESMLIRQVKNNRGTLDAIRKLGVKLGLDDFGTGYSSLGYLQSFTFDTLKIDRAFVSGLAERNRSDVLVRAIIAMGHSLGLEVIAEGIETENQKSALIALGCTRMQGFLFGRPVKASSIRVRSCCTND